MAGDPKGRPAVPVADWGEVEAKSASLPAELWVSLDGAYFYHEHPYFATWGWVLLGGMVRTLARGWGGSDAAMLHEAVFRAGLDAARHLAGVGWRGRLTFRTEDVMVGNQLARRMNVKAAHLVRPWLALKDVLEDVLGGDWSVDIIHRDQNRDAHSLCHLAKAEHRRRRYGD